ncbi:hypothetical protein C8A05DRAFT_44566 [Staphylotrichum tortipilum]|uniref:Uncharacterized protein n=1 Tax=Staphylotrichum tortipilum TaxID=2831512 RepID=A0AAN6ML56_9PEZI|nr:hypothetical protein C8A05DRAFT_44566 [Staphylotrichum longicolle]
MFLPFDIGEIQSALELAYKLIYIGWSDVHDARRNNPYAVSALDVEALRGQLYDMQDAIQRSRAGTGALFAHRHQTPRHLDSIFGNLEETLNDCKTLLESRAQFGTQRGPISNYQWFLLVEDEVNMHRDRIAVLTSKLSLALQSMEVEMHEGQTVMMLELADLLLQRMEAMDSHISRLFRQPPALEPSRALTIPHQLATFLTSIATGRYGRATAIPMADGVQEAIFYLDQATKWHARRQQAQPPAFRWASLLRASWVLQATKESDEYRASVARMTVEEFERQFPRLGMTTRRFFGKLEVVSDPVCRVFEAHAELVASGEVPPLAEQLREVVEEYRTAWERHEEWRPPQQLRGGYHHLGERVASCRLRNSNTSRAGTLDIYRQKPDDDQLTVVSGETLPPTTTVTTQRANRTLGGERLSVSACRIQLWSSTRLSRGSQLPQEFLEPVPPPTPLGIVAPDPPFIPAFSFTQLGDSLDLNPLDAQAAPRRPSWLARASTITSSSSSTATLSTTASSRQPASPKPQKSNKIIQVDKKGTEGCILDQPDPPRMVMFLPDPRGQARIQRPGSLLPPQNPRRRSQPPPPTSPPATRTIPTPPDTRCKKVVLQVNGGASGMSVWETATGEGGWDLGAAGRYHAGSLGKVKRVKKVVVEFGGVDERLRFVEFFGMLRRLYLKDLKNVAFG